MPGFTAPKLAWVRGTRAGDFRATARVLLPKDCLRLHLTGELFSDLLRRSRHLVARCRRARWSDELLAACGPVASGRCRRWSKAASRPGTLLPDARRGLGLRRAWSSPAGGGDNAASAVGIGATHPARLPFAGHIGRDLRRRSGLPAGPGSAVHAFCHACPRRWHQMSRYSIGRRVACAGSRNAHRRRRRSRAARRNRGARASPPAAACFSAISFRRTHAAQRRRMRRRVLRHHRRYRRGPISATRSWKALPSPSPMGSTLWRRAAAGSRRWWRSAAARAAHSGCGCWRARSTAPLVSVAGGEVGPALGAARLGRIAAGDGTIAEVCTSPAPVAAYTPAADLAAELAPRRALYRRLYPALRESFAASVAGR